MPDPWWDSYNRWMEGFNGQQPEPEADENPVPAQSRPRQRDDYNRGQCVLRRMRGRCLTPGCACRTRYDLAAVINRAHSEALLHNETYDMQRQWEQERGEARRQFRYATDQRNLYATTFWNEEAGEFRYVAGDSYCVVEPRIEMVSYHGAYNSEQYAIIRSFTWSHLESLVTDQLRMLIRDSDEGDGLATATIMAIDALNSYFSFSRTQS